MAIDNKSYEPAGSPSSPQQARKVLDRSYPFPGARNVNASFTTSFGSNADLTYTAAVLGTAGNAVTIAYVVAGNNTPLTVSVTGSAVTVNVATGSGGAATSTANQVAAAVAASTPASALLTASLAPGSNGTGVVAALGATPLVGGIDGTKGLQAPGGWSIPLVQGAPFKTGIHYSYN